MDLFCHSLAMYINWSYFWIIHMIISYYHVIGPRVDYSITASFKMYIILNLFKKCWLGHYSTRCQQKKFWMFPLWRWVLRYWLIKKSSWIDNEHNETSTKGYIMHYNKRFLSNMYCNSYRCSFLQSMFYVQCLLNIFDNIIGIIKV